jgi:hypothetical protein
MTADNGEGEVKIQLSIVNDAVWPLAGIGRRPELVFDNPVRASL